MYIYFELSTLELIKQVVRVINKHVVNRLFLSILHYNKSKIKNKKEKYMTMWEWNSNVLSVFFSFLLLCFEFEKTENRRR